MKSIWGLTLCLFLTCSLAANDWPSWRGPSHTGSLTVEGDYPTEWTPESAVWQVKLPGKGASCPVVWEETIYITAPDEGIDTALAYDAQGKLLWQTKFGPETPGKHKQLGTSSNASPVTDGTGVFVYFKSGTLAWLEMDGSIRWQHDLVEQYGKQKLYWDQGASPILVGDLVILPRLHGGDSWVAAFDKNTGEIRWKTERNIEAPAENDHGYGTPVLFQHGDRQALLVWCSDQLSAYAVDDGSLLWSCEGFNKEGAKLWPPIATPVIAGDIAIVPVGRDDRMQAQVHAVRLGGEGDVTATHRLWERKDYGVFVSSPALYDGRVYCLRHKGKLVCLDPQTGEPLWTEQLPRAAAPYYASPVIAGGILYAAREDGTIFSVRIGESYELLGESPMGEQILATPTPFDGQLLVRTEGHLYCVK